MASKWWMQRKSIWRRLAEAALFGHSRGLRHLINASPWVVGIASAAAILMAVWMLRDTVREAVPAVPKGYYYDLQTDKLFVDRAEKVAPIQSPMGEGKLESGMPAGARAYVFSCGSCDDASERFVGYLEIEHRSAYEGQQKLEEAKIGSTVALDEEQLAAWKKGPLARRPRGPRTGWTPVHSERMREILSELRTRCDGRLPRRCRPHPSTPVGRIVD
jgi:hypothetical protein